MLRPSPLKTIVRHAMAMASGDAKTVRDCYVAQTPELQAVVDAYAGMAESIGRLRKASVDTFGDHGFDAIGFGPMFDAEVKRMEQSRFALDADRAIVYVTGSRAATRTAPLFLVWHNNDWRISAADSYARNPKRRAARIAAQAGAYDALAKEIVAGKYKLAVEAKQAGAVKVAEAMKAAEEEVAATTQSTAAPKQ